MRGGGAPSTSRAGAAFSRAARPTKSRDEKRSERVTRSSRVCAVNSGCPGRPSTTTSPATMCSTAGWASAASKAREPSAGSSYVAARRRVASRHVRPSCTQRSAAAVPTSAPWHACRYPARSERADLAPTIQPSDATPTGSEAASSTRARAAAATAGATRTRRLGPSAAGGPRRCAVRASCDFVAALKPASGSSFPSSAADSTPPSGLRRCPGRALCPLESSRPRRSESARRAT